MTQTAETEQGGPARTMARAGGAALVVLVVPDHGVITDRLGDRSTRCGGRGRS
jgi:hypothetical protein